MNNKQLYTIKEMVESFLGQPRVETDIDGWFEYDCPNCADIEGKPDHKHNLPVSYQKGYCHCWKCGFSASIGVLIRKYGSKQLYESYKTFLREIASTLEFQFSMFSDNNRNYLQEIQSDLALPKNIMQVSDCPDAYAYLSKRGITQDIIERYHIQCIPWCDDFKCRCRIVIPSYNRFGDLNYYIARDYTGKQKLKYANPPIPKTKIVFNEQNVDWYDTIYLCEGVFDSIVTPNSIPMLGKGLSEDALLFQTLLERAESDVVVFLDDDAYSDAVKLYHTLNATSLRDRVKLIETPTGFDPSLIHEKNGVRGMIEVLRTAKKIF